MSTQKTETETTTAAERREKWTGKILKKRHRVPGKEKDGVHMVIYDLEKYRTLRDIALRNGSNASAVLNNLYEDFLDKVDAPQKTIETFSVADRTPAVDAPPEVWKKYLDSLTIEQYKELDKKLNVILYLHNKRFRQYG